MTRLPTYLRSYPTYATLLSVVPLTEITRRADDSERSISIGLAGLFLAWLVVTEPTRTGLSNLRERLARHGPHYPT